MEVDSTIEIDSSPSYCSSNSGRSSAFSSHGERERDSGLSIDTHPSIPGHPSGLKLNGQLLQTSRQQGMVDILSTSTMKMPDSLSARELEFMYALHNRRGSFQSEESPLQDGSRVSLSEFSIEQWSPSATDYDCSTCCKRLNPRFRSQILEKYWKVKAVEFLRRRYRVAVLFISLFALLWMVFFSVSPFGSNNMALAVNSVHYSLPFIIAGAVVVLFGILLLVLTFWRHYGKIATFLSITLAIVLMACSILIVVGLNESNIEISSISDQENSGQLGIAIISFVAQFAISGTVVLVVYTLSRLPIWLSTALCVVYMFLLELVSAIYPYLRSGGKFPTGLTDRLFVCSFIARFLFHICLNIVGCSTSYLSQVRLHDTFWRIALCVLSRKVIESERDVEEKTIHSMMPELFAEELMSTEVQLAFMLNKEMLLGKEPVPPALRSISAPFTVCRMNNVSILFADIVGFTRFSSGLSASELVTVLNDIFSAFDDLTEKHRCEKINTLGDCYFCVSGCPTEDENHANNCVDMGLSINKFLTEYDRHQLQMRVGIHTGSVLCGVMGTKRFKFDVWSRDVTIASRIESIAIPGKVVISSDTYDCLSSVLYTTEEIHVSQCPQDLQHMRLYSVTRRRESIGPTPSWRQRIKSIDGVNQSRHSARMSNGLNIDGNQINSTLRDSLSRQSDLKRCVSYTEIAATTPSHQDQIVIDKTIVNLMEEQQVNIDSYYDPGLNLFTLSFDHRHLEERYRNYGRGAEDIGCIHTDLGYNLAKRSYLTDTLSLFCIFLLIMLGSAINFSGGDAFTEGNLWQSWVVILLVGLLIEGTIVIFVLAVFCPNRFPKAFADIAQYSIKWNIRNVVALILIYYPMSIVIVTLTQCHKESDGFYEDYLYVQMAFYITIVVLISSISFMEVSYIAKLVGALLSALLTLILVAAVHRDFCDANLSSPNITNTTPTTIPTTDTNPTRAFSQHNRSLLYDYYTRHILPKSAILFLLVLIILINVNRMSELSVRLSFIGRMEAAIRKQFARQQKNQVEWLLFHIIPPRVALELRSTGHYSRVHDCAGVVFASIVNFSDFSCQQRYNDEQAFRLLNKIVREFDSLLDQPQFSSVEKIKTIGSTYMAASGLDPSQDVPMSVDHLLALIEFALQLSKVLRRVSILVPGFSFLLRVGFNYGPVTSGVVGSNKLLFDIWGDTVNVASRMDSTGQVFKIHMPEKCLELLRPYVISDTSIAHEVNVKGKGSMRTVFVTGIKDQPH